MIRVNRELCVHSKGEAYALTGTRRRYIIDPSG
jgi:hypothetical protein